jgi:hypothetical protein
MVLQQYCSCSEAFCSALLATQTSDVVTSKPPFSSSSIISSISGASSNTSALISTGSTVIHCILTACISTNDLHAAAAMLCIASLSLSHSPATFTLAAAPQTLSTLQMVCGRMSHYASSPSSAAATSALAAASLMLSALLPSPALSPLMFKLASFASPFTHSPPLSTAIHVLAHIVSQQSVESSSSAETTSVSNTRIFATTSLAYFAYYLSSTWDSVASSALSSAAPAASTPRIQLSQTVSHILASSPCQVRLPSVICLRNLVSHSGARSCRDPFCCWCWKKRSRGAAFLCSCHASSSASRIMNRLSVLKIAAHNRRHALPPPALLLTEFCSLFRSNTIWHPELLAERSPLSSSSSSLPASSSHSTIGLPVSLFEPLLNRFFFVLKVSCTSCSRSFLLPSSSSSA